MRKYEILETLEGLARCQGMYRRLLNAWTEEGVLEDALQILEDQNFADAVELIMFIEG